MDNHSSLSRIDTVLMCACFEQLMILRILKYFRAYKERCLLDSRISFT